MTIVRSLKVLLIAASFILVSASPARAQSSGIEVGTSLVTLMVGFGDDSVTVLGVPSGGFGIINPGLFISAFVGQKLAVEPQIGLIAINGGGESAHLLNLGVQVDYFLKGTRENSPYVFGGVGVLHVSDASGTPTSVGGGAGYRMVFGDRLTMRFDGRITHFTEGGGNVFAMTVSLGGIFGKK